jgi:hypothetical protein
MRLLFKALKNPQGANVEDNHLGWNSVEIISFNFDGQGNAVVIHDGKIDICSDEDIRTIISCGWYEFVSPLSPF